MIYSPINNWDRSYPPDIILYHDDDFEDKDEDDNVDEDDDDGGPFPFLYKYFCCKF